MADIKTNLYIPDKIKVGFQEKKDTYTGKLGFVTSYNEKGKLKQEKSFHNWIDENIPTEEFENEPIEGFVLNKNVNNPRWSMRDSYIRIYDPRGFEFEITTENLLYILGEYTCSPGKGLEGKFVYSWDGAKLVLLPVKTKDYEEVMKYNNLLKMSRPVTDKTIEEGYVYVGNLNNGEYLYLGKHDWYEVSKILDKNVKDNERKKTKKFIFARLNKTNNKVAYCITAFDSVKGKFKSLLSTEKSEYFTGIMEKLEFNEHLYPVDFENVELQNMSYEQFQRILKSENPVLMFTCKGQIYNLSNFEKFNGEYMNKDNLQFNIPITCNACMYNPKEYSMRSCKGKKLRMEFTDLKEFYEIMKPKVPLFRLSNGNVYYDASRSK